MDYGFHAPTMSFPVPGTLMVEPTESESKAELDRFIDAMIAIRDEIRAVEEGRADRDDNPLKHAPHTAAAVAARRLDARVRARGGGVSGRRRCVRAKYWPPVARVDNVYGDRNLFCSCIPIADYAETTPRRRRRRDRSRRLPTPARCASSYSARASSASPPRGISPRTATRSPSSTAQPGPALETSFANGGQISASHAEPWANPGAPLQDPASGWGATMRRCCSACAPIRRQWRWGLQFLLECLPSRTRAQHDPVPQPRALFARLPARRCARRPGSSTTSWSAGSCEFYTDAQDVRRGAATARSRCANSACDREVEDGRRVRGDRAGARRLPRPARRRHLHGERRVGRRASLHRRSSRGCAAARGVAFRWGTTVEALAAEGERGPRRALHARRREHARKSLVADAYVVALGSYSPLLLRAARRALPGLSGQRLFGDDRRRRASRRADCLAHRSRARRSCSRASAIACASPAPRSSPATARSSNRVRCEALRQAHVRALSRCGRARRARSSGRACARPRRRTCRWSARTRYRNLFLDTGHGTLGWTMACGSGRALADVIAGRKPRGRFRFHASRSSVPGSKRGSPVAVESRAHRCDAAHRTR